MADRRFNVFVSYVHEDEPVALAVKGLLEVELPLTVFLASDREKVRAGEKWLDAITEALKKADVVVLMLSHRSVRRPWVNFEAGGAWLLDKPIIPCCYGDLKAEQLPDPYRSIQAAHLPKGAHELVRSVHHRLGLTLESHPLHPTGSLFEPGSRRAYDHVTRACVHFADE